MQDFLEDFQSAAKGQQLFVQMPDVCALVFARNSKRGCYCGFFQEISATNQFDHVQWLKSHALVGPESHILCALYQNGVYGAIEQYEYEK